MVQILGPDPLRFTSLIHRMATERLGDGGSGGGGWGRGVRGVGAGRAVEEKPEASRAIMFVIRGSKTNLGWREIIGQS